MVGVAGVHATKLNLVMTAIVVTRPVDLPSVGENVSKSTLDAKFAVSLEVKPMWSECLYSAKNFTTPIHLPLKSICKAHYR